MNSTTLFETSLPKYTFNFKWKFENFSALSASKIIKTPCFCPMPDQEWYIEFKKGSYLNAYLCSMDKVDVTIAYESTICDNTEHVHHSEQKQLCHTGKVRIDILQEFTNITNLKSLPDDVVFFKSILKFYKNKTPMVEMCDLNFECTSAVDQMLLNLESMFEKSEHCDVTLIVEGVTIETHKAILCASSPVFARMFNHNGTETASNIIDKITDISGPIMKKFIALLYYPILKENIDLNTAYDLYYVSDKYEVLSLRNMFSKEMINLLNDENALEILVLADLHNDNRLKEKIIKYVKFNLKSIVNLDGWEKFVAYSSSLAATLINN